MAGYGMLEHEAKRYEGRITSGGILVSVHAEDSAERKRARDIIKRAGAEDISSAAEASAVQRAS